MQEVCKGLRLEQEEQASLQQQLEQQQAQLTAADEQHAAALAPLATLRLTVLDASSDKLLEQVSWPALSIAKLSVFYVKQSALRVGGNAYLGLMLFT